MDGEGIRALLARYCDLLDAADFDGVGVLFDGPADGGCLADEHGTVIARGPEEVAGFYQRSIVLHDGSPRTRHLVLGTWCEPPGRDGTVVARSSFLVLQGIDPGTLVPLIIGRYVDLVAPSEAGSWRFIERRITVDLAGDLSRHLTFDL